MKQHFFSIVIPAHNEELYLAETLQSLAALDYPRHLFEVILVENGSTDKTLDIANTVFRDRSIPGGVYVSGKGSSRAKNFGLTKVSDQSNWIIILDADTILRPAFLNDLDAFFTKKSAQTGSNISVGTTKLLPTGNTSLKAQAWFAFYNFGHRISKTSFAIQIMKASLRDRVHFEEDIQFGEDLKFIKDLLKFGSFCYIETDSVLTSTRRFDAVGWLNLFIKWNWQALVLSKLKSHKKDEYKVIR